MNSPAARQLLWLLLIFLSPPLVAADCVILLHGLARSAGSMNVLESELSHAGFQVINVDYPSRDHKISTLAQLAIEPALASCKERSSETVHFVTHSLGGILVRVYFSDPERVVSGRVVMLGPPNQGSEVVDNLKNVPGFEFINGPAGMELGTDAEGVPARLGPVNFPLGIIAGTETLNPILSGFLPNPDDGKVSVEATQVAGMADFITLPVSHPFLMKDETAIRQTLHFLQYGTFDHSTDSETAND
ncbi:MAG: alpha/beta hydrolase [Pseudomonadales bacterium]|nr:alpha/beta hydrolase [Pseudomonadales bacterium]